MKRKEEENLGVVEIRVEHEHRVREHIRRVRRREHAIFRVHLAIPGHEKKKQEEKKRKCIYSYYFAYAVLSFKMLGGG